VELAGVLLAHTMQEAEAPISQLSEALARVANSLNGGRLGQGRTDATSSAAEAAREAITRDLAVCIEKLQFHDQLMQQLTRVHAILAALATNRQLAHIPAQPGGPGAQAGPGSIELF
jgi:predicted transcriptional regulator